MTPKRCKGSTLKLGFLAWLRPAGSSSRDRKKKHAAELLAEEWQQEKEDEILAHCPGLMIWRGTRSTQDYSESRTCCGVSNEPTKCLIFHLPAFYCSICKQRVIFVY
jgi:hypothetical protein